MNLNIKIDVTKILKEHLFTGKNGAKYLDLTVWANRDGEDKFGNSHMVVQSLPKEARDAGQKGPILGNGKTFGGDKRGGQQSMPAPKGQGGWDDEEDSSIPF